MNGYEKHDVDEDAFGAKGNIVSAFDAFRMSYSYDSLPLVCVLTLVPLPFQLNPSHNM